MGGGATLLAYAIYRQDPVFIVGQAAGLFIYARNIFFIWREKRGEGGASTRSPAAQRRPAASFAAAGRGAKRTCARPAEGVIVREEVGPVSTPAHGAGATLSKAGRTARLVARVTNRIG